jgi:hypothetical protein
MQEFDAQRAWLKGPDFFRRYQVRDTGTPLKEAGLPPDRELLIVEQEGKKAAFVMRELSHPHMAQGALGGKPYLVTF